MTDAQENAQPQVTASSSESFREVSSSSSSASELAVSPARHRKALIVLACVALAAIVLDHLAKQWAIDTLLPRMLSGEGPIQVIGTWVQLTYTENTGAAFSMGTGYTWIFSVIAVVVAIVILRTARKLGSIGWAIALGGLLGGLCGNLIDRLTRSPGIGRGFVVDFIQFPNFPVFNVADSFITCSAVLMVLLTLFGIDYRGGRKDASSSATSSATGSGSSSTSTSPSSSSSSAPDGAE